MKRHGHAAQVRIGTRGSPLARAQAVEAAQRLIDVDPALAEPGMIETVIITTTGDTILDRPLSDVGGKGLFTKEIDEALLAGRIDVAVHSVKDLPTRLPDGIVLAALLPREDPRDAWLGPAGGFSALPTGAVVGTASLRRAAQVRHRRPDLQIAALRGNVGTRLAKLERGVAHATLLAVAGLRRLGLDGDLNHEAMDTDLMLPAVGQGAIGLTCRADDWSRGVVAALDDAETRICITAERALLDCLDGSCRTPIAGLAELNSPGSIALRGLIALPDGSQLYTASRSGGSDEAATLGWELGEALLGQVGPDFLKTLGIRA